MKKLLAIVVLGLFMIGNTYAGTLPPDVQKSLIKNGSIKKGMSFDQVNVATSTGVFKNLIWNFKLDRSGINVFCALSRPGNVYAYEGVGYCFEFGLDYAKKMGVKKNQRKTITQNTTKLIQIWEDPLDMYNYWQSKASDKKELKRIVKEKNFLLKDRPTQMVSQNSTSTQSSSLSTNDKIAQSKQICKDLGFKVKTEKFADCALKMMSMQFEVSNKVASSGGTKQEIIVKHKNDYDIWDALLDTSAILRNNNTSNSSSSSGTNCKVYQREWGADMICR